MAMHMFIMVTRHIPFFPTQPHLPPVHFPAFIFNFVLAFTLEGIFISNIFSKEMTGRLNKAMCTLCGQNSGT